MVFQEAESTILVGTARVAQAELVNHAPNPGNGQSYVYHEVSQVRSTSYSYNLTSSQG